MDVWCDLLQDKYKIDFEERHIETADGEKLHAWLLIQREDSNKKPTLLYFHGNAGNMGFRLTNAVEMFRNSMNVLMVDYRGYGASTGTPTEKGLNLDADVRRRAGVDVLCAVICAD